MRTIQPAGETGSLALPFIVGFNVLSLASAFEWGRLPFAGTQVHLYLILCVLAIPYLLLRRGQIVPLPLLRLALVAMAALTIAISLGPAAERLKFLLKWTATFTTIIVSANLIRSRAHFAWACWTMLYASALLCAWGLFQFVVTAQPVTDVIETGNKNALSTYVLPGLLLGLAVVRTARSGRTQRLLGHVAAFLIILTLLSSTNRSGWLSVGVAVALVYLWPLRWRPLLVVALLFLAVPYAMERLGTTAIFVARYQAGEAKGEAEVGQEDARRLTLIGETGRIFLERPLVGVSPQELDFTLGQHLKDEAGSERLGSHFQPLDLLAAYGVLGTTCFVLFLWGMLRAGRGYLARARLDPSDRLWARTLGMILALWLLRGLFTAEMVFSQCFNLALGYALGFRLLLGREERRTRRLAARQDKVTLATPST